MSTTALESEHKNEAVDAPSAANPDTQAINNTAPVDIERPSLRSWEINMLGGLLIIFSIFTGYVIYRLWPITADQSKWVTRTALFCTQSNNDGSKPTERCFYVDLTSDQRVIILVLMAGALGSFIHAATSFSNFVGQGKIEKSWIWWYILRPLIGMGVALVFYVVFRGGLLNNTQTENLSIYGILTLSALAGLFTDRATLKLEEIFQAMFKPNDARKDKLTEKPLDEKKVDTIQAGAQTPGKKIA